MVKRALTNNIYCICKYVCTWSIRFI